MIPAHRLITGVSAVVLTVLFAGSAGAELPPTGNLPGVPPKPVLTAPNKIPPPPVLKPAPAAPAKIKINCGTFWTGWYQPIDPKTNPCPAGCEPGEKLNERRHLQDGTTWIDAQYQCYGVSTARSTGLETKPIRTKPLSSKAVGTLSPESGKWHTLVTVKGSNFAKAERVAVIWYPNDDDAQAQAGSITATLRKRVGTDEIEIEMPRDAGGTSGGVVRVYLFMPAQLQPVLAGRFTVDNGLALIGRTGGDAPLTMRNNVPGPTLLAVTGEDATTARVSWRPLAGASSYKAHAAANGLNHSVSGPEVKQPVLNGSNQPGLPDAMTYILTGLAPGVGHNVWVTVNYPDGKIGTSDQKTVTTKAGENPKNFRAFVNAISRAPGSVRLEWQGVPGVTHYFVEGSNLPRTQTTNTTFVVPDIRTPGTHEWTVISVYPGGIYSTLNIPRASVVVGGGPAASDRARYRVTVNGFRVNRETLDDPLQRDGKGDEVYIAVYVAEHDSRGNRLSSNLIRPPVVFGDTSGFGRERVSAGSRSGSGGLRSGDGYPGSNPATRTGNPLVGGLPSVVWQGELAAGGNYIVVVPSIWEWDGNSQEYNGWARVVPYNVVAVRERLRQVLPPAAGMPSSGWPGIHFTRASFSGGLAGDRPIGLRASPQSDFYDYFDRAFVLNRDVAEASLTRASPGAVSTRFEDDPGQSHVLGGDYTLYLQVERLP